MAYVITWQGVEFAIVKKYKKNRPTGVARAVLQIDGVGPVDNRPSTD